MATEVAPPGSDSSTALPAASATDVNQLVEVKAKDEEEKSKEAAVEEMNREKVVNENGHENKGSISKGEPILEIEQQEEGEEVQAEAEAGPVLVEIQPSPSFPSELSDSPAKQLEAPVVTNLQVPLNDKFQSTTTTTGENPKEEEIAASSEKVESSTENHQMKVAPCPESLPREKRPAEAEDSIEVAKLENSSFEALKSEKSEDSTKEDEYVQAARSEKSEVSYKDDAQVVNEQIGTANDEVSVKVADAESSQQVQAQTATELKQSIGDSSKQQEPTSKRETVIAVEKEMVSKEDNVNAVAELSSETSPEEVSNQEVQPIKDIQQISKIIASKHQEQTDTKCVADKVLEEQAASSSDNLTDVAEEAISTAMAEESPEAKIVEEATSTTTEEEKIEVVKEEASIVTVNKKGKTEVTKSEEVIEKDKFEMVKVEEEKAETTKAEEEDSETVKEEKNGTLKAEDEEEEKTEAIIYKKLGEKAQSSSSSETVKDNDISAEATAVSASNEKASSAAAAVTSEQVSSKSEETPQKEAATTEDSKVVSSREFAATDNKKKIDDGSESPPKLIEETKNVGDKTNSRKGGGVLHTVGSKVMQSMQKLKSTISCGGSSAVK